MSDTGNVQRRDPVRDRAVTLVRTLLAQHLPEVVDAMVTTDGEDAQVALEMLLTTIVHAETAVRAALSLLEETHGELVSTLREGPTFQRLGERLSGRPREPIPGVGEAEP